MRILAHSALTISLAAALLVGCGGSHPLIGVPGAMPESDTVARARVIVHRIRTASSSYQVLYSFAGRADGSIPEASLIDVNGVLYGTTSSGGKFHRGTVFSITTSGTEHVLHGFGRIHDGKHDGESPQASLIDMGGTLYGTTYWVAHTIRERSSRSARPAESGCCIVLTIAAAATLTAHTLPPA